MHERVDQQTLLQSAGQNLEQIVHTCLEREKAADRNRLTLEPCF